MCTTFLVIVQERTDFEKDIWETREEVTLPDESMPRCGCWLGETTEEQWTKIEASHKASGNLDKFLETKKQAEELNRQFQKRLFDILLSLESWDKRLVIERLC